MSAKEDDPDELLMLAWGVIANVSYGNWQEQPAEWQEAAARWREQFHERLDRPKK